jgi:hypothetical protein
MAAHLAHPIFRNQIFDHKEYRDMEKIEQIAKQDQATVPQLRLRTDLRAGGSLDSCMKSMQDWQANYYKWYNQVNASKPTPCNNIRA